LAQALLAQGASAQAPRGRPFLALRDGAAPKLLASLMGSVGCSQCCANPPNLTVLSDGALESAPRLAHGGETSEEVSATAEAYDEAELAKISQQDRKKRGGVCAEVVSSTQLTNFVKPVYKKSKAEADNLRAIIKREDKLQVLFGHLSDQALTDVINAFQVRNAVEGETVIRQGDEGDCLYICEDGELDIFVARPGADGKIAEGDKGQKVVTVGPGSLFGELALLYSGARAATVVAVSPAGAKLWALEREPFKILLVQTQQTQYQQYEGWLSQVDILKALNQFELSRLADLMESTLFDAGEVIVRQGEPGDKFFILEDGTCAASIAGEHGSREVKVYDTPGEYFGEIALLTDEPRKATIRATGEGCTVLEVSKEDFTNSLGPIVDLLKQNIEKYPKYAEFLG